MKPAFTIGFSLAMGLLNYNFDAVLLGFLKGPTVVGWYNAAYKLLLVGLSVALAYFAGLFPALSRLYVENREEFRLLVRAHCRAVAGFRGAAGGCRNVPRRAGNSLAVRRRVRQFGGAVSGFCCGRRRW